MAKIKGLNSKSQSPSNSHFNSFYSTLSSKNQITVPSKIREKLNAEPGDQIVFKINEDDQLLIDVIKKKSLLDLFGSMPPRGEKTQKKWSEIRKEAKEELYASTEDLSKQE